jgi:DNA polymerase I-like protein with 3'-5' exonuclease and polymerase domains
MIRWEDTLIAHHSYASHYPQKLDQVVSTYLDSAPWKLDFGRRGDGAGGKASKPEAMTSEELVKYNAADVRVTAKAWEAMQVDLAKERPVYDHDICLAELCSAMQKEGIAIDVGRKRLLSKALSDEADALTRQLRRAIGDPHFQPNKVEHVRKALFQTLGVKTFHFTEKGLPSTGKATLETLRGEDSAAGRFASLLSRRREVLKIKSTYVDGEIDELTFALEPGGEKRVHYSWGPRERRDRRTSGGGHTVSGRLASRLQSAPRYNAAHLPDRVREIYVPRRGNRFVYFDVKQGEPRVGAYLSGDPTRIGLCGGDVHAGNAKIMFPDVAAKGWLDGEAMKDPARGKPCRDLAKNMGLAIDYFAEAERVYQYLAQNRFGPDGRVLYGCPSLNTVNAIIAKIRLAYRVYVRFVEGNLSLVRRRGFMRSPVLGRIRWLGWFPPITDVANYPIQSCLADVMNIRTLALAGSPRFRQWLLDNPTAGAKVSLPRRPLRLPKGVSLVGQIHDACIFDTPKPQVETMKDLLTELWAGEIDLPGGRLILPIDLKVGDRWSDL